MYVVRYFGQLFGCFYQVGRLLRTVTAGKGVGSKLVPCHVRSVSFEYGIQRHWVFHLYGKFVYIFQVLCPVLSVYSKARQAVAFGSNGPDVDIIAFYHFVA